MSHKDEMRRLIKLIEYAQAEFQEAEQNIIEQGAKKEFLIYDAALLDKIRKLSGTDVEGCAGTVTSVNPETTAKLEVFAQKYPDRLSPLR